MSRDIEDRYKYRQANAKVIYLNAAGAVRLLLQNM